MCCRTRPHGFPTPRPWTTAARRSVTPNCWTRSEPRDAGDRIGVRIPSGTSELYVSILAILLVGAAYVPVDADDPEERARLVFGEANVAAVLGPGCSIGPGPAGQGRKGPFKGARPPEPGDDAWIIFSSGSTGTPKGVAVRHRSAAAFVDAEARLFLQDDPLGPQDRVLAGLSVAF